MFAVLRASHHEQGVHACRTARACSQAPLAQLQTSRPPPNPPWQVRFINHIMDKHSAVVSKIPELSSLARNLRGFVAANARNWDGDGAPSAAAAPAPAPSASAAGSVAASGAAAGGKAGGCGAGVGDADVMSADARSERDARGGGGRAGVGGR